MERCRCLEYNEIVKNFNFFLPETMHYLQMREPVPPKHCIKWVPNRISYNDPRLIKAILCQKPESIASAEDTVNTSQNYHTKNFEIGTKWIPVLPGLISQRLVNENRKIKMLLQ